MDYLWSWIIFLLSSIIGIILALIISKNKGGWRKFSSIKLFSFLSTAVFVICGLFGLAMLISLPFKCEGYGCLISFFPLFLIIKLSPLLLVLIPLMFLSDSNRKFKWKLLIFNLFCLLLTLIFRKAEVLFF